MNRALSLLCTQPLVRLEERSRSLSFAGRSAFCRPRYLAFHRWLPGSILACFLVLPVQTLRAQAPPLLWANNIGGGRPFAVDAETNLYAYRPGFVIKVSPTGVTLETKRIGPLSGIVQRDSAGNFYFAGAISNTQDFGGVTLEGPANYCAKYSSNGALIWAVPFDRPFYLIGWPTSGLSAVYDVLIDPSGGCYVAYDTMVDRSYSFAWRFAHFSDSGDLQWVETLGSGQSYERVPILLGGATPTNCFYLRTLGNYIGTVHPVHQLVVAYPRSIAQTNTPPVVDDLGQLTLVRGAEPYPDYFFNILTKYTASGTILWSTTNGPGDAEVVLARDPHANVYVGSDRGKLTAYDSNGNFLWTTNYFTTFYQNMIVDAVGNRFVGLANGTVARLQNDLPPTAPVVVGPPASQTAFFGDNVTFSAGVTGTLPLFYNWQFNGVPIPGATATNLNLTAVGLAQAGFYSLVATNVAGSVTSSPALLRVKMVEIYSGNQPLTNGNYSFAIPPLLTIRSAFPHGETLYSLDGSAPNFSSIHYTGPFTLSNSATLRAIGYSADFLQSEEADPVYATVSARHRLTVVPSLGGTVILNPPGGSYLETNVVTVTAAPAPGWTFLYWLGDASGTSAVVSATMERDKTVQAIFGTTLSTTVVGSGQIDLTPAGGVYRYGTVVWVTGIPQPGNYFGLWGNAASGDQNPLYFTLTNPSPTISSIFGSVPQGHAALTLVIKGAGQVTITPAATLYTLGGNVTLTAIPDSGQSFLNWSGDVSSANNPLLVTMNQSLTISANFTAQPKLSVTRPGLEGMTPDGLRMTLTSAPQSVWQILGSTNLDLWQAVGTVSNSYGEVQFTDPGALQLPRRFYRAAPVP